MPWDIIMKSFAYGAFKLIGSSYAEPFYLIWINADRRKARDLDKTIEVRAGTARELVEKIVVEMPFALSPKDEEAWEIQIAQRIQEIRIR